MGAKRKAAQAEIVSHRGVVSEWCIHCFIHAAEAKLRRMREGQASIRPFVGSVGASAALFQFLESTNRGMLRTRLMRMTEKCADAPTRNTIGEGLWLD